MAPNETENFLRTFNGYFQDPASVDVVIAPPYVSIPKASEFIGDHPVVSLAAQNMSPETAGAFTGEISAAMLLELQTKYVILGHSERRAIFGEDDAYINRKLMAALEAKIKPILCIGETLEEREGGKIEEVLKTQLDGSLGECGPRRIMETVIAYEPVWAIGTGLSASPEQAQEAHAFVQPTPSSAACSPRNTAKTAPAKSASNTVVASNLVTQPSSSAKKTSTASSSVEPASSQPASTTSSKQASPSPSALLSKPLLISLLEGP